MLAVDVVTRRAMHENLSAAADKLSFVIRGRKPQFRARTEDCDAEVDEKPALCKARRSRQEE